MFAASWIWNFPFLPSSGRAY